MIVATDPVVGWTLEDYWWIFMFYLQEWRWPLALIAVAVATALVTQMIRAGNDRTRR
jgi:hypothetical protein